MNIVRPNANTELIQQFAVLPVLKRVVLDCDICEVSKPETKISTAGTVMIKIPQSGNPCQIQSSYAVDFDSSLATLSKHNITVQIWINCDQLWWSTLATLIKFNLINLNQSQTRFNLISLMWWRDQFGLQSDLIWLISNNGNPPQTHFIEE